jgi:hypothetical protein
MKHVMLTTLALLLSAGHAMASVDTTPPPGGVYKLKPGMYVAKGSECSAPANAALLQYDGKGLSGAHTRACKATVRSLKGSRFTVDQSCIAAGAGPAPRSVQRQIVLVSDALNFTQTIKGRSTSYAYCPVDQLPTDLRR